MSLPADYRVVFTGHAKSLQETFGNFLVAFGLAMILVYMILAAQFEHFVHPVSIMLAVPLSLPFALGTGPGSGGRASRAKVIIGGQMLCLLLTPLATPISYSIFDDWGVGRFRFARCKEQ